MMKVAAACGVVFAILDAIWLGLVMSGFYRSQLAPIVRLSADGGIAHSTLKEYPLAVTLVDMCWGAFGTAVCGITTRAIVES